MPPKNRPDTNKQIEDRLHNLLSQMTLEEKIGQMTQVEKNSIRPRDVRKYNIGSVLSGGGGHPRQNTPSAWAQMVNTYQEYALQTRLQIPLIYGADAVHGHSNVNGAVIFPHNIGLGATRNSDLVCRIAKTTAEEMAATGIYWNFAPTITVPQDIRWGRTYEGFSENTELVTTLGLAYLRGLQGAGLDDPFSVLATPKHFLGDGGTVWGSSNFLDHKLDQGDTRLDEATLRKIFLPPYISAIQNGAMCIMASFSSWNGLKLTGNSYLLSHVLKGELGFQGFIVTDWQAIDQLSTDYYQAVVMAINAGIDMSMVPYDYKNFISTLLHAVQQGDVAEYRINDAVSRILRVKLMLGLFDHPFANTELLSQVGSESHRLLAHQAVSESLVLLKNDHQTLPISKDLELILVAGKAADNLGLQCGGWTIEWQGIDGNLIPGTTILQGLGNIASPATQVIYAPSGRFPATALAGLNTFPAEVGIVVVGESPYAEGFGDRADLHLATSDVELIRLMRSMCQRLVVVLLSGRPMIITDQLPMIDAFICAWLPGQAGEAIAEALFGVNKFVGRLPYSWPRSMDQVRLGPQEGEVKHPLFPYGYGLEI